MMGLQGLFVIEENRPNNWVQTLNVGAGKVRAPSVAVLEEIKIPAASGRGIHLC